jgi:hypothetical protein
LVSSLRVECHCSVFFLDLRNSGFANVG